MFNSFSQTEELWINETCLKAKIKASAWKTIRKTQYDNYEDYFQVFRGFSKKSYPEMFVLSTPYAFKKPFTINGVYIKPFSKLKMA